MNPPSSLRFEAGWYGFVSLFYGKTLRSSLKHRRNKTPAGCRLLITRSTPRTHNFHGKEIHKRSYVDFRSYLAVVPNHESSVLRNGILEQHWNPLKAAENSVDKFETAETHGFGIQYRFLVEPNQGPSITLLRVRSVACRAPNPQPGEKRSVCSNTLSRRLSCQQLKFIRIPLTFLAAVMVRIPPGDWV